MSLKILFSLSLLITICTCFHNPGIVIQIPNNLTLPIIHPSVPQSIPSVVAQKLQLTEIYLRQIDYSWKISGQKFIIQLQRTLISFNWKYGHDSGLGTFTQEYCNLIINWSLVMDSGSRFKLEIDQAKITNEDKRHSIKIKLGGGVPQTVVIEVTNLILNNAKIAFRTAIKSVVAKVVEQFTQPLRKDYKIICNKMDNGQNKQDCIYLNTTLVSKPIITDNIQFVQVNGAPYRTGHSSGFLDPSDAIIKLNSNQIAVQVHQQLVTNVIKLYNQIFTLEKIIDSTQITSTIDIDSQTLSVIMPKLKVYADPRPVILTIKILAVQAAFSQPPFITFKANGFLKVQTLVPGTKQLQQYLNKAVGYITVKLNPLIVSSRAAVLIQKLAIDKLQFDKSDLDKMIVNPPEIVKHFGTLMEIVKQAMNGDLYRKIKDLQFAGLKLEPKISILKNSLGAELHFA